MVREGCVSVNSFGPLAYMRTACQDFETRVVEWYFSRKQNRVAGAQEAVNGQWKTRYGTPHPPYRLP